MLVDSHCHLNFPQISKEFDHVLRRAQENNVGLMQTISTKLSEVPEIISIIEAHSHIFGSVGIHPNNVDEHPDISFSQLLNYFNHPKIIGVGETGLDFYYQHSEKKRQEDFFSMHIEVAKNTKLPLIIHSRAADNETISILKDHDSYSGLIHCFSSESLDFAKQCLDLGLYISISGIITFKKALALKEIVKFIPLDRLIIETDTPYLAPVPHRGETNEPAFVKYVAQEISLLKNISFAVVEQATTDNFFRLFSKATL